MSFPILRRDVKNRGQVIKVTDLQPSDNSLLFISSDNTSVLSTDSRGEIPQTPFSTKLTEELVLPPKLNTTYVRGNAYDNLGHNVFNEVGIHPIYCYTSNGGFLGHNNWARIRLSFEFAEPTIITRFDIDNSHARNTTGPMTLLGRSTTELLVSGTNHFVDFADVTPDASGVGQSILGSGPLAQHTTARRTEFQNFPLENSNFFKYYIMDMGPSYGDNYHGLYHIKAYKNAGAQDKKLILMNDHLDEAYLQSSSEESPILVPTYPLDDNIDGLSVVEGQVSLVDGELQLLGLNQKTILRTDDFVGGDFKLLISLRELALYTSELLVRMTHLVDDYRYLRVTDSKFYIGRYDHGEISETELLRNSEYINVAQDKETTASHTQGGVNGPEAAVDGDASTWFSTGADASGPNCDWILDLGELLPISYMEIFGPGHRVTHDIYFSSNGVDYEKVETYTSDTTDKHIFYSSEQVTRFIKIGISNSNGWNNWSEIYEVKVFVSDTNIQAPEDIKILIERDEFEWKFSIKDAKWSGPFIPDSLDLSRRPVFMEIEVDGIDCFLSELQWKNLEVARVAPRNTGTDTRGREHHFWSQANGLLEWSPKFDNRFLRDSAGLTSWNLPEIPQEEDSRVFVPMTTTSEIESGSIELNEFTLFASFRQKAYTGSLLGEDIRIEHDGSKFIFEFGSFYKDHVYGLQLNEWKLIVIRVSTTNVQFWYDGLMLFDEPLTSQTGAITKIGTHNSGSPDFDGDIEFIYVLDGYRSNSFIYNFVYTYNNDIVVNDLIIDVTEYAHHVEYTIDGRNIKDDLPDTIAKLRFHRDDYPELLEEITSPDLLPHIYVSVDNLPVPVEYPSDLVDPDVITLTVRLKDLRELEDYKIDVYFDKEAPINWYYGGFPGSAEFVYDEHYLTVVEPFNNWVDNNKSLMPSTDSNLVSLNTTQAQNRTTIDVWPAVTHSQTNTGYEDQSYTMTEHAEITVEIFGESMSGYYFNDSYRPAASSQTYGAISLQGSAYGTSLLLGAFGSNGQDRFLYVNKPDIQYNAFSVNAEGYIKLVVNDRVEDADVWETDLFSMSSYSRLLGSSLATTTGSYSCARISGVARSAAYHFLQNEAHTHSLEEFIAPDNNLDLPPSPSASILFTDEQLETGIIEFALLESDYPDLFDVCQFSDRLRIANLSATIYRDPVEIEVLSYGEGFVNLRITTDLTVVELQPENTLVISYGYPFYTGHVFVEGRIRNPDYLIDHDYELIDLGDFKYIILDPQDDLDRVHKIMYLIAPPASPHEIISEDDILFNNIQQLSMYPTTFVGDFRVTAGSRWWSCYGYIKNDAVLGDSLWGVYTNNINTTYSNTYVINRDVNPEETVRTNPPITYKWYKGEIDSDYLYGYAKGGTTRMRMVSNTALTMVNNGCSGGTYSATNTAYNPNFIDAQNTEAYLGGFKLYTETAAALEASYTLPVAVLGKIRVNAAIDTTISFPLYFPESHRDIIQSGAGSYQSWFYEGKVILIKDVSVYEGIGTLQDAVNRVPDHGVLLINNSVYIDGNTRTTLNNPIHIRSLDHADVNPRIGSLTINVRYGDVVLDHIDTIPPSSNWTVGVICNWYSSYKIHLNGCRFWSYNGYSYPISVDVGARNLVMTNCDVSRGYAHLLYRNLGGHTEFLKCYTNNALYIYQNAGTHNNDYVHTTSVSGYGSGYAEPVIMDYQDHGDNYASINVVDCPNLNRSNTRSVRTNIELTTNQDLDFNLIESFPTVDQFSKPMIDTGMTYMVGDQERYNYSHTDRTVITAYDMALDKDWTIFVGVDEDWSESLKTIICTDDFELFYEHDTLILQAGDAVDVKVCDRQSLVRSAIKLSYNSSAGILKLDQPVSLFVMTTLNRSRVCIGASNQTVSGTFFYNAYFFSFSDTFIEGPVVANISYENHTIPEAEDDERLVGWNTLNNVGVLIPSEHLPEPIINFPLIVKLSTSSGVNGHDFSDVLAELRNPLVPEDWDVEGILNFGIWETAGLAQVTENRLILEQGSSITSQFSFNPTFSVEFGGSSPAEGDFAVELIGAETCSVTRDYTDPDLTLNSDINGVTNQVSLTSNEIYVKFTRTSSNLVTAFYKETLTGDWITFNSGYVSGPVNLKITQDVTQSNNNFSSGYFIAQPNSYFWPNYIPYDVSRLALENEYGRHMYGEVVHSSANKLYIYTRVDALHDSINTPMSVRYDSTKNNHRIDFGGTLYSRGVWKDTIRGVNHLNRPTVHGVVSSFNSSLELQDNGTSLIDEASGFVDAPTGLGQTFNGTSDCITLNALALYLNQPSHSISIWKKTQDPVDPSTFTMPWSITTSTGANRTLLCERLTGTLGVVLDSDSADFDDNVFDDIWRQIVVTVSPEGGTKVYKDGSLFGETPYYSTVVATDIINIACDIDTVTKNDWHHGALAGAHFHAEQLTPEWIDMDYRATKDQLLIYSNQGFASPDWDLSPEIAINLDIHPNDYPTDLDILRIRLSNSCGNNNFDATPIFAEVSANFLKIGVSQDGTERKCFVKDWDHVTGEALVLVKIDPLEPLKFKFHYGNSQPDNILYVSNTLTYAEELFSDYSVFMEKGELLTSGTLTASQPDPSIFDGTNPITIDGSHNHRDTISIEMAFNGQLAEGGDIIGLLSRQDYPTPSSDSYALGYSHAGIIFNTYAGGCDFLGLAIHGNKDHHLLLTKTNNDVSLFVDGIEYLPKVNSLDSMVGNLNSLVVGGWGAHENLEGTISTLTLTRNTRTRDYCKIQYLQITDRLLIFDAEYQQIDTTAWNQANQIDFRLHDLILDQDIDNVELDLYIDTTSGIQDDDLTAFFTELQNGEDEYPKNFVIESLGPHLMSDYFSESSLNYDRWTQTLISSTSLETSGGRRLRMVANTTANSEGHILSRFKAKGDFEVEVKHTIAGGYTGILNSKCYLQVVGDNIFRIEDHSNSDHHVWSSKTTAGNATYDTRTQISGYFRIKKIGSQIFGYGQEIDSTEEVFLVSDVMDVEEVFLSVGVENHSTAGTYTVDFEEFRVISGEITWEEDPYIQTKMFIPAEIRSWDPDNLSMILRTQLPSAFCFADTALRLWFDRNQDPVQLNNFLGERRANEWLTAGGFHFDHPDTTDLVSLSENNSINVLADQDEYGSKGVFNGSSSRITYTDSLSPSSFAVETLLNSNMMNDRGYIISKSSYPFNDGVDSMEVYIDGSDNKVKATIRGSGAAQGFSGNVLTVGPGKEYSTVMSAYGAASPGDTLLIEPGTYNNESFQMNKAVHLFGNTDDPDGNPVRLTQTDSSQNFYTQTSSSTTWFDPSYEKIHVERITFHHTYGWRHAIALYHTYGTWVFNRCVLKDMGTYIYTISGHQNVGSPDAQGMSTEFINCWIDRGYAHTHVYRYGNIHFIRCYLTHTSYYCYSDCRRGLATSDYVTSPTPEYGPDYGDDTLYNTALFSNDTRLIEGPELTPGEDHHVVFSNNSLNCRSRFIVDGQTYEIDVFVVCQENNIPWTIGQPGLPSGDSYSFDGSMRDTKLHIGLFSDQYFYIRNKSVRDELLIYSEPIEASGSGSASGSTEPDPEEWPPENVITLTLPPAPEVLTDFPLEINLTSDAGITDADLAELFEDLHAPTIYEASDLFNDSINDVRWRFTTSEGSAYIHQNKLRFRAFTTSSSGLRAGYELTSNFVYNGDFDLSIRGISSQILEDGVKQVFSLIGESYSFSLGSKMDGTPRFFADSNVLGMVVDDASSLITHDDEFSLRFRRIDGVLTAYIQTISDWIEICSEINIDVPLSISLGLELPDGGITLENSCYWYDFLNRSGNYFWKPDTNAQRISIINAADDELFTEIDTWTIEDSKIICKVPTYLDTENLILRLRYDVRHSVNKEFVHFTDSLITNEVWDDDYVLSAHMVANRNRVIDSTGVNHGAITDSPLSTPTYPGEGLLLDGIDDEINFGNNTTLDLTTAFTFEVVFRTIGELNNTNVTDFISFLSKQEEPDSGEDTYNFGINTSGQLELNSQGGTIQSTTDLWGADSRFVVAATYNSVGLTGDLFINGVKETLSVDALSSMAGSLNSLIVGRHLVHSNLLIEDTRISKVIRSDNWLMSAYQSYVDALITYDRQSTPSDIVYPHLDLLIEASEVPEDENNIPVLVNLSTASGPDSYDATAMFTALDEGCCGAHFTEADGELPDPNIWAPKGYGDVKVMNQKLRLYTPAGFARWSVLRSKFKLVTDFEFIVDYEVLLDNADTHTYIALADDDGAYALLTRKSDGALNYYFDDYRTTITNIGTQVATGTTGRYKIARVSDVIEASVWVVDDWVSLGFMTDARDTYISFGITAFNTLPEFEAVFNNLTITPTDYVWPEGYPHAKRIEMTYIDGPVDHVDLGREQLNELVSWEQGVPSAQLWTRAHHLSSTDDTIFRLKYGKNMPLNLGYNQFTSDSLYNMIIDIGKEGVLDNAQSNGPMMTRKGDKFELCYVGNNQNILMTTSYDSQNWTNPVHILDNPPTIAPYTGNIHLPQIIEDGRGVYRIYYRAEDPSTSPSTYAIMTATSSDKINWIDHTLAVGISNGDGATPHGATHSFVIREHGSLYHMWYGGYDNGDYKIYYVTSIDGVNWSTATLSIDINQEGTADTVYVVAPRVIKLDSGYIAFYRGYDGSNWHILSAKSSDGIQWYSNQVVLSHGAEGTYDSVHVSDFTVIYAGENVYMLVYTGHDGTNSRLIQTWIIDEE